MYNEIASFKQYLRNTVLPQLGSCNLYTNTIGITPSFPAVFVKFLREQDSTIQTCFEALIQVDIITENNDDRTALTITDKLLTALGFRRPYAIDNCTVFDYSDPTNPVNTGNRIKWIQKTDVRKIIGLKDNFGNNMADFNNPELVRYVLEMKLIYA